jgi:hypothetical protein
MRTMEKIMKITESKGGWEVSYGCSRGGRGGRGRDGVGWDGEEAY